MTKNNKNVKTKIIAGTVAVLMGTSIGAIGAAKLNSFDKLYAYQSAISVSNGDFSNTNYGTPASPTNWTGIKNYANTKSGVVDLSTTNTNTIKDDYKLESLPAPKNSNESKKNVLMINANSGPYYAGYKTGSTISFEKQSYYKIAVDAYTFYGTQTIGSFSLTGNEKIENDAKSVVKINGTDGEWKTYSIYLATGEFDSLSLDINLFLGQNEQASEGAIFFDNVSVVRFDKEAFFDKNPGAELNSNFIDLSSENDVANFLLNANFEDGMNGWSVCDDVLATQTHAGVYKIGAGYNLGLENVENPNKNYTTSSYALLINNIASGHYGYQSSEFTISQYGMYKLSFWAKTDSNANATAKLVEVDPYDENVGYEEQTFTISNISTSSYSNNYTNGWKEYSFYIKGSPFVDTQMKLEFWLGTEGSDSSGYVWFDNIKLTKISSEQFDNNSSNGTKADLYQSTSTLDFSNANFNIFKVEDVNQNYPCGVDSWTASNTDENAKVGIVNTAKTAENSALGFNLPVLDGSTNNNVLMINNASFQKQTVLSSSKSLDADSFYKVEIYAYANTNGSASVSLVSGDVILGEQNQIEDAEWTKYTFFVKTGFESKSINVQLGLGKDVACTGYAFFDRVLMTKYSEESNYTTAVENANNNSKIVDLNKFDFSNTGKQIENNIYASNDFEGLLLDGESATIVAGVDKSNNNLVIKSLNDEVYYRFTSNSKFKLEKDNYYQFDVTLKTNSIVQDEKNTKGAKILFGDINSSFNQIDTKGEEKTYSAYIKCTEEKNVSIVISLGDTDALTQGSVEISNINIAKITADDYEEATKITAKNDAPDNVLTIGNTDSKKDEESKDSSKSGIQFDWLLVPTIITALAIIIAVVGAIWRQYKRKHKRKINYAIENAKKAEQNTKNAHKAEIQSINAQIAKLNEKQTKLAEEINKLNAENAEENKGQVEELTAKYNETKNKLEKLNQQKKDKIKRHRQEVSGIKEQKKAEKKLTNKK